MFRKTKVVLQTIWWFKWWILLGLIILFLFGCLLFAVGTTLDIVVNHPEKIGESLSNWVEKFNQGLTK